MTEPRPLSGRIDDLPSLPVKEYGEGIGKRVVFGPGRFWEEYTVRFFTTTPGKKTPFHAHDWPHYVIVVEGRGRALIAGRTYELSAGSWAHVPANADHFFENACDGDFRFVCIVPSRGDPFREGPEQTGGVC